MGQVTVTLLGRTYRFGCGDGEEARIRDLAAYLDRKAAKLCGELGQPADDRILAMAGLMITDELFEAREQLSAQSLIRPSPPRSANAEADPRPSQPSAASPQSHYAVPDLAERRTPRGRALAGSGTRGDDDKGSSEG
jgi:cell division protein ZapA